jgi:hypothetical protein
MVYQMAKNLSLGLFWEEPEYRPKQAIKREAPEPFWLDPNYLPDYEAVQNWRPDVMNITELIAAAKTDPFICDIECYTNYFLIGWRSTLTDKVYWMEMSSDIPELPKNLPLPQLRWMMENLQNVTFNGRGYDIPMINLALTGMGCAMLKKCSSDIINVGVKPHFLYRQYRAGDCSKWDHVDIKEVCPLTGSLKKYGSRIHTRKMQDLPFHWDSTLTWPQIASTRMYCVANDTRVTKELFEGLEEPLKLRVSISQQIGKDVRSRSDAQVAEDILRVRLEALLGYRIEPPEIPPGTTYRYESPGYFKFETPVLQDIYATVKALEFVVGESGSIGLPSALSGKNIVIGAGVYRMGIGGLHSSEASVSYVVPEGWIMRDADVASMYPSLILNMKLCPPQLGEAFLEVYDGIRSERLDSKARAKEIAKILKDLTGEDVKVLALNDEMAVCKVGDQTLKIALNGTYGKLGSKWSIVYAPNMIIQVTLTGQLSLLMLIERLELAGIRVLSANTDGVVAFFPKELEETYHAICKQWEKDTFMELEFADYAALYSRDVNNYIAVKPDGKTKKKGAYGNPWADGNIIEQLKKSPQHTICIEAVEQHILHGTPLRDTIELCQDLCKFVIVKEVDGGGVCGRQHLGRVARWYYGIGSIGEIVYARNGNKVPGSEGAIPCMELPTMFPNNIDYARYVAIAEGILQDIAFTPANASGAPTGYERQWSSEEPSCIPEQLV